jgi:outer membrane receptor protein involved in Fe transport
MRLALLVALVQAPVEEIAETVVRSPRSRAPATDTRADRVVVTAEELAATGERSLPRQLAKAAGVWLQETNLGGGAPLLQGLSGNQILLVIDGVRMNDATTRNGVNQMLNGVDPATVERVEVIRGPRSVLYGSDALGGVVLIWTKTRKPHGGDASRAGIGAAVQGQADTATEGWTGAAELSAAGRDFAGLLVGGYHDWGKLHSGAGEVENTGYEGDSLFGSFESSLGEKRGLRLTSTITRDYDVPRTDRLNAGFGQTQPSNSEYEFSLQDRQRVVLAYADRSDDLFVDALEARLSLRYYDEQRTIRGFGSSTRRLERDTTQTVGLGVDLKQALGEHQLLTFGFDADYDDVDSSRLDVDLGTGTGTPNDGAFAPGSRFFSSGLFVQDEIASFQPFDVTVGARWSFFEFGFDEVATGEEVEGDFDALCGNLSLGAPLSKDVRLVGTVARGFRAPNLAELARDATFFGGDELHNADLDPESSLYGELAFEVAKATWFGSVAVFQNSISDVVGSRLIDPGGPGTGDETYLRENIGTLEVFGVLARGRTQLGGADSPWSAQAAVEYAHGQQYSDFVDPNTGEKPFDDVPGQRIPPLHGWVGLRYEVGPGWLGWVELGTAWALEQDRLSPQDLADPRIDPDGTDGWATLDLDVGGPVGGPSTESRWYLGVHNLLDEQYRVHGSGIDGPGVGLVVGARWSR